jgi:hypothetical protein
VKLNRITLALGQLNEKDFTDEQALIDALLPLLSGNQLEDMIRKSMTTEERHALAARLAS